MALTDPYYAVIEAGGTKFNCAIVTPDKDIVAEIRIPTTTPEETLSATVAFFSAQREAGYPFSKMGIASFGPLDLDPASPTYGYITKTPKPHWSNTDLANALASALDCEVVIDTDVNGAALGEYRWGAAQGAGSGGGDGRSAPAGPVGVARGRGGAGGQAQGLDLLRRVQQTAEGAGRQEGGPRRDAGPHGDGASGGVLRAGDEAGGPVPGDGQGLHGRAAAR